MNQLACLGLLLCISLFVEKCFQQKALRVIFMTSLVGLNSQGRKCKRCLWVWYIFSKLCCESSLFK